MPMAGSAGESWASPQAARELGTGEPWSPGTLPTSRFHEKRARLPPIQGVTTLGEDAEAFFRTGDEGTYEGGPASDIPYALCDEPTEELTVGVTDEQLERRRRLKRIVATIVGALGTGVVLLFGWLLAVSAHATPVQSTQAAARPFLPPKAAPAAQPALASSPAIVTAPETRPAPAPPTPSIAAVPAETPTEERPSERAKPAVSSARSAIAARPRRRAFALPETSILRAHASFGSTGPMLHHPPTANFPD
jgi:hypothetical protein